MTRVVRLTAWLTAVLLLVIAALGIGGYSLFVSPHVDSLRKADAVVVLGGEWDGRVAYGLELARLGFTDNVVLSTSYWHREAEMKAACAAGTERVTVYCFAPEPNTTRGEAIFSADIASAKHWSKLIVVSWSYHMVRARYIFGSCFDGQLFMRSVPRRYDFSVTEWTHIFAYQYAAMVKALRLGCRS